MEWLSGSLALIAICTRNDDVARHVEAIASLVDPGGYSGDCDRLVRPMVITQSGDRDHLQHVALCEAAGRMAVAGRYD